MPDNNQSLDTSGPGVGDSVPSGINKFDRLPVEFGRYRVHQVLGQGAMGAVYRAHDTRLGRDVALKTPKLDATTDPELIERFEREARAAAALHHRNICPVFDVGEHEGVRFLTMAHIDGRPLSDLISEDKLLPERQAANLVRKLALALYQAHQAGVVHRDLKPVNIMIDQDREPVVMDFGLAQHGETIEQSRLTAVGTLMGSPAYMSPEQVSGDPQAVGLESDIYSLGVVLFELLTARLPYEGGVAAMIGQIIAAPVPAVRESRSDCDTTLDAICFKMMAKEKVERYPSMKVVADELGQFLKQSKRASSTNLPATPDRDSVSTVDETASVERSSVAQPTPEKSTASHSRPVSVRTKRIALGLGGIAGIAILAGVIIHFSNGTRVEVEDGTDATVKRESDGRTETFTISAKTEDQSSDTEPGVPTTSTDDVAVTPSADGRNADEESPTDSDSTSQPSPDANEALARDSGSTAEPSSSGADESSETNRAPTVVELTGTLTGHQEWIRDLEFTPDGQQLVSCSFDKSVRIWDLKSSRELYSVSTPTRCTALALSPDGRQAVAAGQGQTIVVVDLESGRILRKLRPGGTRNGKSYEGVAWSPDGSRIAAACLDKSGRIWSAESGQLFLTFPIIAPSNGPCEIHYTADGERLVIAPQGKPGRVQVLDAMDGSEEMRIAINEQSAASADLAIAPDSTRFVSGTWKGSMILGDLEQGKTTSVIQVAGGSPTAAKVCWSPDGAWIAFGHPGGTVYLVDAFRMGVAHRIREGRKPTALAFSRDSSSLAVAFSGNASRGLEIQVFAVPAPD